MKRAKANSGGGDAAGAPGVGPVLLQVYLWDAAGAVPEPMFAMARDLVRVRGGELGEGNDGTVTASFPDAVSAVTAARNLQRMVQGFASGFQAGVLGGCTTLRLGEEASVDAQALRGEDGLSGMHPGQVVVLGRLCDEAAAIPGLQLVTLSGAARRMRVQPPVAMDGYVDGPFVTRVAVERAGAMAGGPEEAMQQAPLPLITKPMMRVTDATPAMKKAKAVPAPAAAPKTPAAKVAEVREPPPVLPSSEAGDARLRAQSPAESAGWGRWAMLGGAAVLVVGAVLFALPGKKNGTVPVPASQGTEDRIPPSPNPSLSPSPSVVTQGPPAVDPARSKVAGQPHERQARGVPTPVEAKPDPEPPRPVGGIRFTHDEVVRMIANADKESGDGKFDRAINDYNVALRSEPGNEAAKAGRARAIRNKEHQ